MKFLATLTFTSSQTNGLALYYGTKEYKNEAAAKADILRLQAEFGGSYTYEQFTTRERHLEILYACSANHDKLYYPQGIENLPPIPVIEPEPEQLYEITDTITGIVYEQWASNEEDAFYGACEGSDLDAEHAVTIRIIQPPVTV